MTRIKKNIDCFNDTINLIKTNTTLKESVQLSKKNQKIILQTDDVQYSKDRFPINCNVYVTQSTSFDAARSYKEGKVCVLNFANFYVPGGVVKGGSSAQEECLCRESTLYENISDENCRNNFYDKHVGLDIIANDDLIYTPDVIIFKDSNGNLLDESDWKKVDIITCAAPNVVLTELSDEDLLEIHISRGRKIMATAASQGCDTIILGAFGCGVFANNPVIVAQAYNVLVEEFKNSFRNIEFAIYGKNPDDINYNTFRSLV